MQRKTTEAANPKQPSATADAETAIVIKARKAAYRGGKCPTIQNLTSGENPYTTAQAEAYIAAFNAAVGDSEKQALRRVTQLARSAACSGGKCPTIQSLTSGKSPYTMAQAEAYIAEFNAKAGDPEQQALKRAIGLARKAARRGGKCPTIESLTSGENPYTTAHAQAYIAAFNAKAGDPEKQALTRVTVLAKKAAQRGEACPTIQSLMNGKNPYTMAQAEAYLAAFKTAAEAQVLNPEDQVLKRVAELAGVAARRGRKCPTIQRLTSGKNPYTIAQAEAYIAAFEAAADVPEKQVLKNISELARSAAYRGGQCPTIQSLTSGETPYTLVQAETYIAAFKETAPNSEKQKLRKVTRAARIVARDGGKCPTIQSLTSGENPYTTSQAEAYIAAFKETAGDPEKQVLRRVTELARKAAGRGDPCPTIESLMSGEKNYTIAQAEAYVAAFNAAAGDSEKQALRRVIQFARNAACSGSECPSREQLVKTYTEAEAQAYEQAYAKAVAKHSAEEFGLTLVAASDLAPHGGVHHKYIGEPLPLVPYQSGNGERADYVTTVQFQDLADRDEAGKFKSSYKMTYAGFEGVYYSCQSLPDENTQVTFVCAGRLTNARLPAPQEGRCVLVITQEEYPDICNCLPDHVDVLVVEGLDSTDYGRYTSLSLVTCRRLAIFLCAASLKLAHFMMLDDNIQGIKLNEDIDGWDAVYNFALSQLNAHACVSVRTESIRPQLPKELGSKCFLINMAKISERLIGEQLYWLFPNSAQAHLWGEDYYFQLILHVLFQENGFEVLNEQTICLNRSCRHRNYFAADGKKAVPFVSSNHLNTELQSLAADVVARLNQIIMDGQEAYNRYLSYVTHVNLLGRHARVNGVESGSDDICIALSELPFEARFNATVERTIFVEGFLRDFQQQAVHSILKSTQGHLMLATGAGKSRVEYEVARLAYSCIDIGEYVIVVTPHLDLTNQLYHSFIASNELVGTKDGLYVPNQNIIKVCSDASSISLNLFCLNNSLKGNKAIIIFCVDSFAKMIKLHPEFLSQVPCLILDEYHDYKELLSDWMGTDTRIIGLSATPPLQNPLGDAWYSYSRQQAIADGVLAPVIADSLTMEYSENNVQSLIKMLPTLLRQQCHPRFLQTRTLCQSKGIVYLPSVKDCAQAYQILQEAGIRGYVINSDNPRRKEDLADFVNSKAAGVVLAVEMLRFGFDCPNLAWIIIAQNNRSALVYEQQLGRVLRLYENKIGYVMTFAGAPYRVISQLIGSTPPVAALSAGYLERRKLVSRLPELVDTESQPVLADSRMLRFSSSVNRRALDTVASDCIKNFNQPQPSSLMRFNSAG